MTWIRFDPEEPAATIDRLLNLPGARQELVQVYGQTNLVIYFAHSLACRACRAAIDEFVRRAKDFTERDAVIVVVLQEGDLDRAEIFFPVHILIDPNNAAREQLGRLLEFDTRGKLLLVILNIYAAPSAAWVGDDPGPEDELHQRALQRLDYISIQCPE